MAKHPVSEKNKVFLLHKSIKAPHRGNGEGKIRRKRNQTPSMIHVNYTAWKLDLNNYESRVLQSISSLHPGALPAHPGALYAHSGDLHAQP